MILLWFCISFRTLFYWSSITILSCSILYCLCMMDFPIKLFYPNVLLVLPRGIYWEMGASKYDRAVILPLVVDLSYSRGDKWLTDYSLGLWLFLVLMSDPISLSLTGVVKVFIYFSSSFSNLLFNDFIGKFSPFSLYLWFWLLRLIWPCFSLDCRSLDL